MYSPTTDDNLSQIKGLLAKAREAALVIEHRKPGVFRVSGSSTHDLLNRMSTNDLSRMPVNTVHETVLTTAHARIIDRIWVLVLDSATTVLTSHGSEEKVLNWLRKHIFFQDDVQISSNEGDWSLWEVLGPEAQQVLSSAFPALQIPGENSLVAGDGLIVWTTRHPVPGLRLLLQPFQANILQKYVAEKEGHHLLDQAYEIMRVRAGIPRSPNEINEEYIPLEVGLWDAVSFTKGCYTGQEIIARMESRGKLARQLSAFHLNGYAPPGSPIRQGKRLLGPLTSIILSPDDGWIGLGIIKPPADNGEKVTLTVGEEQVPAEIIEFSAT